MGAQTLTVNRSSTGLGKPYIREMRKGMTLSIVVGNHPLIEGWIRNS